MAKKEPSSKCPCGRTGQFLIGGINFCKVCVTHNIPPHKKDVQK